MLQETNKCIVLVGIGATPVPADVVAVTDPVLPTPKVGTGTTDAVGTGALGNSKGYVDKANSTVEFDVKSVLRAPVSLGAACEISKLLKIAGLAETLTPGTSAVYKPGGITSDGTGQAKVYNDGSFRLVTGAAANLKIAGKIGEPITATFSIKGISDPVPTADPNPAVTLNGGAQIIMSNENTEFLVAASEISIKDFELDLACDIQRSYGSNTNLFYINNFKPKLSVTAIKTKTTDDIAWTQIKNGGTSVLKLTVGIANEQIVIDVPNAFCEDVNESPDQGRVSMKRSWSLENGGTANNNFTITFK